MWRRTALLEPCGGMIGLLRPKSPMLAWLQGLQNEMSVSIPGTLAELSLEMSVFWLPMEDAPEVAIQYLKRQWQGVWEAELVQWTENRELWPPRLRKHFDEWFEVEIRELVYALK